ncbi:MAG: type I-E CRISPR-associated endoribonuclease Cas2e [Bacillota bacterium]|nr:type I-E CRISPR-associated endoribonuclease Cas2e [Bacillota bacterium]
MVVVTISKCSPRLRGDISKWLMEISTGVYVGRINARVREQLWERICEHSDCGEAIMVFSAKNEQGFSFYVHNVEWKPTDYDGIMLLKRPLPPKVEKAPRKKRSSGKQKSTKNVIQDVTKDLVEQKIGIPKSFVAIDIETTGLKSEEDQIIELAAIRYNEKGEQVEHFTTLIKIEKSIPLNIVELTGITDELLKNEGIELKEAIGKLLEFLQQDILVGHYIGFDMRFIKKACKDLQLELGERKVIDTVSYAKNKSNLAVINYRLETLVQELGISEKQQHRALPDAELAAKLFIKLNEI